MVETTGSGDVPEVPGTMTDAELTEVIYASLRERYSDHYRYVFAREVPLPRCLNRLDGVCVHCYASEGYAVDGFEVKASVADLKRDLMNPGKHVPAYEFIDSFTLVTTWDVVKGHYDVLPKTWGVLLYDVAKGTLRSKRRALALHDDARDTIDRDFAVLFLRRAVAQNLSEGEVELRVRDAYERGRQSVLSEDWSAQQREKYHKGLRDIADALGKSWWWDEPDLLVREIEGLKERAGLDLDSLLDDLLTAGMSSLRFLDEIRRYRSDIPEDFVKRYSSLFGKGK